MEQIVETTGTKTAVTDHFKTATSVSGKEQARNRRERPDRTTPQNETGNTRDHFKKAWGAFCSKAHAFGLQEQDLNLLMQVGRVTHTHDGQQLFCEGECNDAIFLILDGKVKLGETARKPFWMDFGPYGMINMDEDMAPVWKDYQVCTVSHCLGCLVPTREPRHSRTAISEGECDLLVLDTLSLKDKLSVYDKSHQSARILSSLRRMQG